MNTKLESFNAQLERTIQLLEEQERLLSSQNTTGENTGLSESDKLELRRY